MILTEIHEIKTNHPYWKICDDLCFRSKNLYNTCLYYIKNEYFVNNKYINYIELNKKFILENIESYRNLPTKVSQQTMMIVDRNYKSFFKAIQEFNKHPNKFQSCPKEPRFKHKVKGRFITVFNNQSISKKGFKDGYALLSGTTIKVKTDKSYDQIQQINIVPTSIGTYKILVLYKVEDVPIKSDNDLYCGIDIGLNNLFAVSFNNNKTNNNQQNILVKGTPLKAINQYYNKKRAELQSKLIGDNKSSKAIRKLTRKRNNKIKDFTHKATKELVEQLKQTNVSKVIIGKNDNWKQDINIGKKNNQNFVSIPHANIISILDYKLKLIGVEVQYVEESYTSKCSAYDLETVRKHENYVGKRVKRGLFKTLNGKRINADINGASNILRKAVPNAYNNVDGIEGIVVYPKTLKILN